MVTKRIEFDEDFVSANIGSGEVRTANGIWVFDGVGTEAVARVAPEVDAPGILRLTTGSSSSDSCRLVYGSDLSGAQICLANQVIDFSIRFRLSSTTNVQLLAGLFDDSAPASAGVARYAFIDTTSNINTFSGSAESGTDLINTTIAASTSWRTFRARVNGAGNLAAYQMLDEDGEVLARGIHAAEIVDATPVFLVVQIVTGGAAARSVDIDRITLRTKEIAR